ncbi:MAG: hypothetical protein IH934_03090 [Nanoarchaeota archaeon]|nr:hypothetical protein [Nanoarchaeota archaeon]
MIFFGLEERVGNLIRQTPQSAQKVLNFTTMHLGSSIGSAKGFIKDHPYGTIMGTYSTSMMAVAIGSLYLSYVTGKPSWSLIAAQAIAQGYVLPLSLAILRHDEEINGLDYRDFSQMSSDEELITLNEGKKAIADAAIPHLRNELLPLLSDAPYSANQLYNKIPKHLKRVMGEGSSRDPERIIAQVFEGDKDIIRRHAPNGKIYFGLESKAYEAAPQPSIILSPI